MNICKLRLLLIVMAVVCVFTNCAPPMGTLWDFDENGQTPRVPADSLWTIPLRMLYDTTPTSNSFRPAADLLVFIAHEGLTYELPIYEVDIQLADDPNDPVFVTIFNGNGNGNGNGVYHRFTREGRYLVRVAYQDIYSAPYSVQVGGLEGGSNGGSGGNGDEGIQLIWRPLVTFNSNGGSRVPNQRLDFGAQAVEPPPPTRAGFTFGGWYVNQSFTRPYDFSRPVNQSITLYARWL